MNLQPTLENELVIIRPLQASDFEAAYQAASDPLIWEQHAFPNRHQLEYFKILFDESLESNSNVVFIDPKTKKIFGWSRFYDFDAELNEVVIGYTFMSRAYWGGKYNKSIKAQLVDYALKSVGRVLFHVDENNKRSQKAMEKIGARLLTERLEKTKTDGTKRFLLIYELK